MGGFAKDLLAIPGYLDGVSVGDGGVVQAG